MRRNCCHVSVASSMKIFNFVQAFIGVSIIAYSIWMLNEYNRHLPVDPPPSPPVTSSSSGIEFAKVCKPLKNPYDFTASIVLGSNGGDHGFNLCSLDLPAPWFIYSFMAVGILVCIVTFIGFIAAEAINGYYLYFYSILKVLLILLEAGLVAYIVIDRHREKDLPYDPTGELSSLRAFTEEKVDISKWVGIAVVAVQLLSLLLAMVLKAMVSTPKPELEEEDDYANPRSRASDPLLGPQGNQASDGSRKIENWSSRIKEKYGLN